MATISRTEHHPAAARPQVEPRKARPIVGWAVFGAVCIATMWFSIIRWIEWGPRNVPAGPTPVPTWMHWVVHIWEVVGLVVMVVVLYYVLVRPWRRDGMISLDGLFCLVLLFTVYWQDMGPNFFQVWVSYNAVMVNVGSWYNFIPFWQSPQGSFAAAPILWDIPIYVYCMLGMMVVGCRVAARAQARWPALGAMGTLGVLYLFFLVFNTVAEVIWLRTGIYFYPGVIKSMTWFHGEYYQYPYYESFVAAMWWTGMTAIRYFRNDLGQTLAERGLERLNVRHRQKSWIRFLALAGIMNAVFFSYNIPAAILGMYADSWPQSVTGRSWMTDGMCGPGTPYACPAPGVPISKPSSGHLTPDGTFLENPDQDWWPWEPTTTKHPSAP